MCTLLQNFAWDGYVPAFGFGRDSGIKSVQQNQIAKAVKKWVKKCHSELDQQVRSINKLKDNYVYSSNAAVTFTLNCEHSLQEHFQCLLLCAAKTTIHLCLACSIYWVKSGLSAPSQASTRHSGS